MANEINLKFGASLSGSAKSVFSSLANGLKTVASQMKTLAKEQIALGKVDAAAGLNNTAKALDKTVKEITSYTKETGKATEATGRFSTVTKQLSKSMQTYARYMVSSTILRSITGGFGSATSAIQEHNQALHDLKAIMSATTPEVINMEKAILDVAANTKFSIGETAGAMKLLGQAGFSAGDAINALEPIANLATGTLSTLQSTVNLVSTAIRVFNLETSETARVTDIYANAVNRSKLTIDKLNTAMNYIGPIANAAGVTIEETATSMMLLANAGLRASTIGTGMRRMLTLLLKPTSAFKKAVYEAGYTMDDFNPKMNKFSDIVGKLGGIVTDAEGAVKMFGIRGASVISAFAEGGQAEFERLADAVSRTGTASKMAAEQMKGLTIAIKNMKDKFGVLAVAMGKAGFTKAWSLIVNAVRALEDGLISLANSGIGQFVMSAAGLATAVLAVVASFTLLTKIFTSKAALLFGAQIVELTAQMLALNFSVSAFQGATLVGSFAKLKIAITSVKATMISLISSFSIVSGVIIAIVAIVGALSLGWKRYNDSLKATIQKNEALSGSYELVLSAMDNYNRVLEKNGEDSKKFISVKDRLLKTFDKFGGALKGYTQLQADLNDELKDETITVGESVSIWAEKADLLKDKLVGNVKDLSAEELELKDQVELAAEALRNENTSLEDQKEAVEVLANSINTKLLQAYSDQADASYKLWQKSQIITNIWDGIKFAGVSVLTAGWKLLGAELDLIGNKLFNVDNLAEKAVHGIFGVGDSYAYLKRQAEGGNEKAQEALAQIDTYAKSTSKVLTKNINPLTLTKEKVEELVAASAKLGDYAPAILERLTFELTKMGKEAKDSAANFKEAFGSDLSSNGKDALKGILFVLNESKDKVSDLSTAFQEMSEVGDTSKLAGSLEALEAGLQSGKISAEEVKLVMSKLFEKLPADKWDTFQKAVQRDMALLGKNSVVMSSAIAALTTASFDKFGLSLGVLSKDFSDFSNAFTILVDSGAASMDQITSSFKTLSGKVKTLGDLNSLITTFQDLRSSGQITGFALERSFDAIQASFKKAFKEPLKEVETARKAVLAVAKGMSKVYETEAKTISSSFETAYAKIATDFVTLKNKINTDDLSNNRTQMRMTDAYKKFTSDSLREIEKFKTESMVLFDKQSTDVVATAKKMGVDVTAIERKINTDKTAVYKTTIAKHKALMDQLVALEQNRREKVRSLEQDILNIRSSYDNDVRDMKRGGMTDSAAYTDTLSELRSIRYELNNTKTGTEQWNALMSRGKDLASNINAEVKEGDNIIVSSQKALRTAIKEKKALLNIEVQAKEEAMRLAAAEERSAKRLQAVVKEKQATAKKAAADLANEVSTNLATATTKFSDSIDKLAKLLDNHAPIIDASNLLDEVNAEIDTLSEDETGTIALGIDLKLDDIKSKIQDLTKSPDIPKIETDLVIDDNDSQMVLKDLNTVMDHLLDLEKVDASISINADEVKDVQQAVYELSQVEGLEFTATVDGKEITMLEENIELLDGKEVTINTNIPSNDIVAVSKLQSAIDKLKDKKITITTVYKTVGTPYSANQETGGPVVPVLHRATGGSTDEPYGEFEDMKGPMVRKGSGHKDDVPTMLTKGEFVLKQSIVKKLGSNFLNSLNAGRFALKDLVAGLASGGMVTPISNLKSTIKNMDLGNIANNMATGRKTDLTSSVSPVQQTGSMMDQLKDFGVVTLNTGKEQFKTIAHKDVVGQLTDHLTLMKRFST